ncbi:CCA tRNA nucleotidyltransferase [Brevundimonas goettingensis]|uniref:CCA tRNA nucleotidyltransferase n=1 Tax=Brevundimonas goettingensis TaxID=2774190 RepID=A0A975GUG4_9CAUL|nr:CCA tRNA nucleotidyltransferase [Brevundimonas goettingensis]QTC89997.1 CCA tRNA nucleotidyltransferase [Brevundimonas goettingensis]
MSASVADQDWLTAPATRAVLDALEAAGGPDCVRFVGGCVRNALMGQTVDDLDLATRLLPEATMAALQKAGLKVVPTGIAHGTVTAVSKGRPYEITTLRRDVSTDGRNATVAFTDDWAEDAARRDFRLNALYADAQGRVFDPTGQGVEDAREGRIVFVGEPETRIREDYLRILRFFRFFAWYGRGEPDTAGLAACADLSEGMVRLSAERVSKELLKLLAAPDPRPAVRAMSETGVLARLLPEADQPAAFEVMVGLTGDPVLRLSALLSSDQPKVEAAAKRLRLPNAMRDRLLAAAGGEVDPATDARTARALIYRLGKPTFADRVLRAEAMSNRPGASAALLELADRWPVPRLPVGGRQVAAAGLAAGPLTGQVLAAFEDGWIADDFPTEGHADRLRMLVEALPG